MIEKFISPQVRAVYEVFQEYFGEENVDIQWSDEIKENNTFIEDYLDAPDNTMTFEDLLSFTDMSTFDFRGLMERTLNYDWNLIEDDFYELSFEEFLTKYSDVGTSWLPKIVNLTVVSIAQILVRFPEIQVTNENDESTNIKDLWAKVYVSNQGKLKGGFTLNRSHYPFYHFNQNYMHSHISNIPYDDFSEFQSPCLGKGPINNTIITLNGDFDLGIWALFCVELGRYVRVESIEGVPYHHLAKIEKGESETRLLDSFTFKVEFFDSNNRIDQEQFPLIDDFLDYLIGHKALRFSMKDSTIILAMSWEDYILTLTNEFTSWVNSLDLNAKTPGNIDAWRKLLVNATLVTGIYYMTKTKVDTDYNISDYEGSLICTFKGQDIKLHIDDSSDVVSKYPVKLMNNKVAHAIISKILIAVNYDKDEVFGLHNYTSGEEVIIL